MVPAVFPDRRVDRERGGGPTFARTRIDDEERGRVSESIIHIDFR